MGTPSLFRFSILRDSATWFAVDANDDVITQSSPYFLQYSPDGWADTDIQWVRSKTYWGIGRTLTTPYQMVKDGRLIMNHVYYTEGIEGKATIVVEKRNDTTWEYEPYYRGDIDFSNYEGSRDRATARIIDSTVQAKLNANETTPQEIPILDPGSETVNMDGINLLSTYTWLLPEQGIIQDLSLSRFFALQALQTEGSVSGTMYSVSPPGGGPTVRPDLDKDKIYEALRPQTVTVRIEDFNVFVYWESVGGLSRTFAVHIRYGDPNGIINSVPIWTAPAPLASGASTTYNIPASEITISLAEGEQVSAYFFMMVGGGSPNVDSNINSRFRVFGNDGRLKITTVSRVPATPCRGYRYFEVANKLIESIAGTAAVGPSPFLGNALISRGANWDSKPFNLIVTCGDALRQLGNPAVPDEAPKLKVTMAELVKDFRRWQLAMTVINEQVSIVRMQDVFDANTEIYSLGSVSEFTQVPFTELFFNQLNVGFQERDYDGLNGRDEFNQSMTYALGFTHSQDVEDWVSQWRGDMYGVEYTRANLLGKNTTDSDSDNDTFLLDTADNTIAGRLQLYRPNNSTNTSGILFPSTAFNISLDPARTTLRNGQYLASVMHLRPTGQLTFKTADKNAELVSNIGSGTVVSKSDIPASSLPQPLFLPILFRFTANTPDNMMALMATNPHGYFTFVWKGVELRGYVMEVGTKPAMHDAYDFTLVAHPTADLNALKRL